MNIPVLEKSDKKTLVFLSWRDIKSSKMGGAEVFTHQMLKRLNHEVYRIIHLSPKEDKLSSDENIDGIRYLRDGNIISVINELDTFLLAMAMAALGIETNFNKIKGVGMKPIYLALILFVWLVVVGYALIKFI